MTSITRVTTDTRVPVVLGASDTATTRQQTNTAGRDAGLAGWSGAMADRLAAPVLSATAAIGSLHARQRTYQALAGAVDVVRSPEADTPDLPTVLRDLTALVVAHRAREAAAVHDTVTSANLLVRDIAQAQAQLQRPGAPGGSTTAEVRRRDALVQAWARLTGGSAAPTDDGGVELTLGGRVVLDAAGPRPLAVVPEPGSPGRLAVTVRTPGGAEQVRVTSGVIGGQVEVVNDVIPHVLAALAGADRSSGSGSASGLGLPWLSAQQTAAGPRTEYLRAQGFGVDPGQDGVLIERHLGVMSAEVAQAAAAETVALQRVNAAVVSMGTAANAVTDGAGQLAVRVGRPDLLSASIDPLGRPEPVAVNLTVLSVAAPPSAVSELAFGADDVLNGGRPFSFGVQEESGEQTRVTTVSVAEFPTVRDVVAAINSSGAGVRAVTSQIATGTVQLLVTSLVTGRTAQVTITDGQQPPATSTILGRFQASEGTDSVLAVDRGGRDIDVVTSSSTVVTDAVPGVVLRLSAADPATPVPLAVERDLAGRSRQVESLVDAAGSVLESVFRATSAGAAVTGDRMLATIAGRVVAELTGPAGRAVPGLAIGRHALSVDRDQLQRALRADPAGTDELLTALAGGLAEVSREVSQPREGYLAIRLQADPIAAADYRTHRGGAEDVLSRHQERLDDRFRALESLLGRLGGQASWLSGELPAG